jgi:hypothetical protein
VRSAAQKQERGRVAAPQSLTLLVSGF